MNYFVVFFGHISYMNRYEEARILAQEFDGVLYNAWAFR